MNEKKIIEEIKKHGLKIFRGEKFCYTYRAKSRFYLKILEKNNNLPGFDGFAIAQKELEKRKNTPLAWKKEISKIKEEINIERNITENQYNKIMSNYYLNKIK